MWSRDKSNQNFVRTPHARKRHQPRTASKIANKPAATGIKPTHHNVSPAMMIPAISKTVPTMPRAMRPWKLMLRSKNRDILHNSLSPTQAQTQQGLTHPVFRTAPPKKEQPKCHLQRDSSKQIPSDYLIEPALRFRRFAAYFFPMEATESIQCPFCGQSFEITVDTSVPSQRFTTDCEVCCRPFEVVVECEPGEILSLEVSGN
jgi:hypothetical protein